MNIVSVGEITIDRYLDLGVERVGGISLNFAVHARRALGPAGGRVALVSCVGDDGRAGPVRELLAREGVDAARVSVLPGATAHQDIVLLPGGERHFPPGGYGAGALAGFRLSDEDLALVGAADVVAAPLFRQIAHLFWQAMRAPGLKGRRVADLLDGADVAGGAGLGAIDELLDTLDLAFLSGGAELVETLLPRTRDSRALLVVTHGAGGSTALVRGEAIHQPALPVGAPVDTTGCGDAFGAAFAVTYFRGGDVRAALAAGAARAAGVARHLGATGP